MRTETSNYENGNGLPGSIRAHQLIWGEQIERFVDEFGRADLILASDLFYMTKSLPPLCRTVAHLLRDGGIFLAVNLCATQSSREEILEVFEEIFTWEEESSEGSNETKDLLVFRPR